MGYTAFYPLPKAAFTADGVLADGFERRADRQRPLQDEGQVAARPADPGREGRRLQGHRAEDRRHHLEDLPGPDGAVRRPGRRQPRRGDDQIPIESLASASGDLGDRFQKSPSSGFAFVGFPTFEKEFAERRRPAGALHGDQPAGDDRPDLPRLADAGDVVRVAGGGRLPRRTPAARTASTTRPRPRQLYDAGRWPEGHQDHVQRRRWPQGLGRRHVQPDQGVARRSTASASASPSSPTC